MMKNIFVKLWLMVFFIAFTSLPCMAIEINNPYVGRITPSGSNLGQQRFYLGHPRQPYQPQNIQKPQTFGKTDLGPSNEQRSWCRTRYRSYRQSDNSYVNQLGIRKPCIMP